MKNTTMLLWLLLWIIALSWCSISNDQINKITNEDNQSDQILSNIYTWDNMIDTWANHTNIYTDDRMTLALAAPRSSDKYYASRYDDIMEFIVWYAKAIIWHDNVVIFVDDKAYNVLSKELPEDILIKYPQQDIWMRDFSTTNPNNPIQWVYTDTAQWWKQSDSDYVQSNFNKRLSPKYEIQKTILKMDWWNIVDNYNWDIIVSDRFLEDNNLSYKEWIAKLKDILWAKRVAIIANDDPDWLAHADGMVAWIDDKVLAINIYEEPLRTKIIDEIKKQFPDVKIIEVEAKFDDTVRDSKISSACGINLNAVLTKNYIYMPDFGTAHDQDVLVQIQSNTSKKVIPISASSVCSMWWSVRCLTRQTHWDLAKIVLESTNK